MKLRTTGINPARQAVPAYVLLRGYEVGNLVQEPTIDPASFVDGLHGKTKSESFSDPQDVVRSALAQGLANPLLVDRAVRAARACDLHFVEAYEPGLQ